MAVRSTWPSIQDKRAVGTVWVVLQHTGIDCAPMDSDIVALPVAGPGGRQACVPRAHRRRRRAPVQPAAAVARHPGA